VKIISLDEEGNGKYYLNYRGEECGGMSNVKGFCYF
jgi:hypothetical protein